MHNFTIYSPCAVGPSLMHGSLYNTYKVHKNHVITIIMTLMLKSTKIRNKLGKLVTHSAGDARVKVKNDKQVWRLWPNTPIEFDPFPPLGYRYLSLTKLSIHLQTTEEISLPSLISFYFAVLELKLFVSFNVHTNRSGSYWDNRAIPRLQAHWKMKSICICKIFQILLK